MTIEISRITHRGEPKLKLEFAYDMRKIALIKQVEGYAWSKTLNSWLIPDSPQSIERLKHLFQSDELLFESGPDLHHEARAGVESKTTIVSPPENKTPLPKTDVSIEVINRKILIKMPKNEADIGFIRTLRYSRWSNNHRLWEIPDYPGNLDLINDHFRGRISELKIHDKLAVNQTGDPKRSIKRSEVLMIKTRSGRVKIISEFSKPLISAIKAIPYNRWDAKNKWWTIPFSESFVQQLTEVCVNNQLKVLTEEEPAGQAGIKRISELDVPNYRRAPDSYIHKLTELRYSAHTIKNYVSSFQEFINYFFRVEIDSITEPQIQEFLRFLVTERRVSLSYQNVAINAIKFYYEKVLRGQRKFYYIDRPRREKTLPEVLNEAEITAMIKSVSNVKHKLIIMLGYSSGLRLGEIVRLKLSHFDRDRMQIRIEQSKGKKDRYTKLSVKLLPVLDEYIAEYNPDRLLFTGTAGHEYSVRSVQQIVKDIAAKAGVTKKVSTKTLRHTFATHSLERGVGLRYIQGMMGHESSKTTEIYTHITTKGFENIKSPMDDLDI